MCSAIPRWLANVAIACARGQSQHAHGGAPAHFFFRMMILLAGCLASSRLGPGIVLTPPALQTSAGSWPLALVLSAQL